MYHPAGSASSLTSSLIGGRRSGAATQRLRPHCEILEGPGNTHFQGIYHRPGSASHPSRDLPRPGSFQVHGSAVTSKPLHGGWGQPSQGQGCGRRGGLRLGRLYDRIAARTYRCSSVEGERHPGIPLNGANLEQPPGSAPFCSGRGGKPAPAGTAPLELQTTGGGIAGRPAARAQDEQPEEPAWGSVHG
jgi:hypothetical protein